jgi:hypothetical protein
VRVKLVAVSMCASYLTWSSARSRQGGQSTCATVTERKTGSYPGRWPRSAQRCLATAEATGWAPPGVAVTRVSGLQPTLSSRVRVAVRFTFRAPLAAWCHGVHWSDCGLGRCSVTLRSPEQSDRLLGRRALPTVQTAEETTGPRRVAGVLECRTISSRPYKPATSRRPNEPGSPAPRANRPAHGVLHHPVSRRSTAAPPAPCTWGRRGSVGDREPGRIGTHKVP